MKDEVHLFRWRHTDDHGRRRVTRYLLTEEEARARLRDPERVEGSLEIRTPGTSTSDFLRASPSSKPGG